MAYWGQSSDLWGWSVFCLFVCVRVKECVCLRHILSASKCSLGCECINHTVTASKKMTLSKKVSLSTVTQHGNQTIARLAEPDFKLSAWSTSCLILDKYG